MAGVRDFTDLAAWKLADAARTEIQRITSTSAFRRHPTLRQQLLDASDSACSNTAEGFSRFRPKDFARFLRISRGSLSEVLDRLMAARGRGLVSAEDYERVCSLVRRARGACTALIRYLDSAKEP